MKIAQNCPLSKLSCQQKNIDDVIIKNEQFRPKFRQNLLTPSWKPTREPEEYAVPQCCPDVGQCVSLFNNKRNGRFLLMKPLCVLATANSVLKEQHFSKFPGKMQYLGSGCSKLKAAVAVNYVLLLPNLVRRIPGASLLIMTFIEVKGHQRSKTMLFCYQTWSEEFLVQVYYDNEGQR